MKVYLVTDGSYSDYRVLGVYSTTKKAAEAHGQYAAENDVEEYEMDFIPPHPPGLLFWLVSMNKDGSIYEDESSSETPSREPIPDDENEWKKKTPFIPQTTWRGKDNLVTHVDFYVWAKDPEHAIKIANEVRVQIIANNLWLDDHEAWMRLIYPKEET